MVVPFLIRERPLLWAEWYREAAATMAHLEDQWSLSQDDFTVSVSEGAQVMQLEALYTEEPFWAGPVPQFRGYHPVTLS